MRYTYLISGSALGFILVAAGAPPAFATQNTWQFEPQLTALQDLLANPKNDALEAIRAELALRKSILGNILDCSIGEIQGIKATLHVLSSGNPDITDLINRFSNKLDEAAAYYTSQKSAVGDLGIWGSKDMARTIAERRDSYLNPLTQGVAQFAIWAKNQDLFRVAENRLGQIQTTVKILKLIDNQEMSGRVEKAKDSFANAKAFNEEARQTLLRMDISDNSLTLIKNSLEALAETYANFFEVSKAVAVPQ